MTLSFQEMLIHYPVRTCFVTLVIAQAVVYILCTAFKSLGGGYSGGYSCCDLDDNINDDND